MPVPLGGSTNWPFGPPNVWMTPTDLFPGSPTVAIWIVTTPRFSTGRTDELVLVVSVEVVAVDPELPPHAVAPTDSAASRPMANQWYRMEHLLCRAQRAV